MSHTYPTAGDYVSVLNSVNLSKIAHIPYLQNGKVREGPMGPMVWSGGYAIVVQFQSNQDRKSWALRCFCAAVQDVRHHYAEVHRFLAQSRPSYFVECGYYERGLTVKGQIQPVVLMEWIDGLSLKKFVEQNLGNQTVILNLAEQWRAMLRDLQASRIAHGDLQDENIKITQGAHGPVIKLLDYDTLVVPATEGCPEGNTGLPAYQHPRRKLLRTKHHRIDAFSALAVYLSLRALAERPTLWTDLDCARREKEFLFASNDFLNPSGSRTFQILSRLSSEICGLARVLQGYCSESDATRLPFLEEVLTVGAAGGARISDSWLPHPAPKPAAAPTIAGPIDAREWLPKVAVKPTAVPVAPVVQQSATSLSSPIPPSQWLSISSLSPAAQTSPQSPVASIPPIQPSQWFSGSQTSQSVMAQPSPVPGPAPPPLFTPVGVSQPLSSGTTGLIAPLAILTGKRGSQPNRWSIATAVIVLLLVFYGGGTLISNIITSRRAETERQRAEEILRREKEAAAVRARQDQERRQAEAEAAEKRVHEAAKRKVAEEKAARLRQAELEAARLQEEQAAAQQQREREEEERRKAQEAAERRKRFVLIQSAPSGAEVRFYGRVLGRTPLRVGVQPPAEASETGLFAIKLSLPGYADATRLLTLRSGENSPVWVNLMPVSESRVASSGSPYCFNCPPPRVRLRAGIGRTRNDGTTLGEDDVIDPFDSSSRSDKSRNRSRKRPPAVGENDVLDPF